jgi:hypothetical protein
VCYVGYVTRARELQRMCYTDTRAAEDEAHSRESEEKNKEVGTDQCSDLLNYYLQAMVEQVSCKAMVTIDSDLAQPRIPPHSH